MSSVIDDLATVPGIHAYLQDRPQFAAHTVQKLSGGLGNFTYRIHLQCPFAGRQTLVLKYAPPYAAASGGSFPLDQKRQVLDNSPIAIVGIDSENQTIEAQGLRLAGQLRKDSASFVLVPIVHLFDEERHVLILDDAGEASKTLKELLIKENIPKTVAEQIGGALGEFISSVHDWHQNADVDLTAFADNQVGKFVTALITYGKVEPALTGKDHFPALADPLLDIPEAKMATIAKVVEKRQMAIYAASPSDPMTHGDFWTGNLVLLPRRDADGSIVGVEKLYVLDWECCKTGLPGLDIGQLCAEIYTVSEFYPERAEATRAILGSFLGAYVERMGKGVGLARIVASHIGAHLVGVTPRVSSWTGREKTREVVAKGVDLMVLGEEGTELSLKESIVGQLI